MTFNALYESIKAAIAQPDAFTLWLRFSNSGRSFEYAVHDVRHQMVLAKPVGPGLEKAEADWISFERVTAVDVDIYSLKTPIWPDDGKIGAARWVISRLPAYGFAERGAGGGCVAWNRTLPDGRSILITDCDGTDLPNPFNWMIGVYLDASFEPDGSLYRYCNEPMAMDAALLDLLGATPLCEAAEPVDECLPHLLIRDGLELLDAVRSVDFDGDAGEDLAVELVDGRCFRVSWEEVITQTVAERDQWGGRGLGATPQFKRRDR